jgi:hypothetical protein
MPSRLFRRKKTCVNLFLDQRVVFGELVHLAIAHDVDARVADVSYDVLCLREKERGDRAPHPEFVALGTGPLEYGPIRIAERARHPVMGIGGFQIVQVRKVVAHDLHRHLARDFPGRVPAHAVSDYEQAAIGVG